MNSLVRLFTPAIFCTALFAPTPSAPAQTMFVANPGADVISQVDAVGTVSTYVSGFTDPWGLAVDGSGNLFVGDNVDGKVYKVTPSLVVSEFASGFLAAPLGMAVDASGNLYVADVSTGVYRITPAGSMSLFASGMSYPRDVAFTATGDLYAAGGYNPMSLYSIATDGTPTLFTTEAGMSGFNALDIDSTGTLAVSNNVNSTIYKVTPGGSVSTFLTGYSAEGLAFDDADNLYFTVSSGTIFRATPGGTVTTFATGFSSPKGIVFAAVPEPSAVAAILGAIVLGLSALRGRRRA